MVLDIGTAEELAVVLDIGAAEELAVVLALAVEKELAVVLALGAEEELAVVLAFGAAEELAVVFPSTEPLDLSHRSLCRARRSPESMEKMGLKKLHTKKNTKRRLD